MQFIQDAIYQSLGGVVQDTSLRKDCTLRYDKHNKNSKHNKRSKHNKHNKHNQHTKPTNTTSTTNTADTANTTNTTSTSNKTKHLCISYYWQPAVNQNRKVEMWLDNLLGWHDTLEAWNIYILWLTTWDLFSKQNKS